MGDLPIKTKKLAVLALLPACSFVMGLLDVRTGAERADALLTIHALLSVGLVLAWFWLDTVERAYKPSWFLKLAVASLSFFALPYYLLRSRGFVGGLKAVCLSLAVFIVTMVFYRASAWLG